MRTRGRFLVVNAAGCNETRRNHQPLRRPPAIKGGRRDGTTCHRPGPARLTALAVVVVVFLRLVGSTRIDDLMRRSGAVRWKKKKQLWSGL